MIRRHVVEATATTAVAVGTQLATDVLSRVETIAWTVVTALVVQAALFLARVLADKWRLRRGRTPTLPEVPRARRRLPSNAPRE